MVTRENLGSISLKTDQARGVPPFSTSPSRHPSRCRKRGYPPGGSHARPHHKIAKGPKPTTHMGFPSKASSFDGDDLSNFDAKAAVKAVNWKFVAVGALAAVALIWAAKKYHWVK